jgi:two-component system phosphate regulon sensor histidine kinase PhoR
MTSIDLERLLAKESTRASILAAIRAGDSTISIETAEGTVLFGTPVDDPACKHPVRVDEELLGWVSGGSDAALVATLLGYLSRSAGQIQAFEDYNRQKNLWVRHVGHDLKAPVGLIMGYAGLLKDGGTITDDEDLDFLDEIIRAGAHMDRLIKDLSLFLRLETTDVLVMKDYSLKRLFQECLDEAENESADKDIQFTLTLPEQEVEVFVDPGHIEQVLCHILSNAVKYTGTGGQVTVQARRAEDTVVITIADTGFGFIEDDLPHVFYPFHRFTRPEHIISQSTGLQMPIAKAIIEQHGGRIEVESTHGTGTTFTITLPLKSA